MLSPFPGMDPYLESACWLNFHARLAVEIADRLNPALRPNYVAVVERRTILSDYQSEEDKRRSRYPDVSVLRERHASDGGSAVAEPPVTMSVPMPYEEPYHWVEIISVGDHELVTAIEILSPSNKISRGRVEYLQKREEIMLSSAHLVEIDLQRGGQRLPVEGDLPPAPYYVFLSRSGRRPKIGVWPIQLQDRLPVISIPVKRPDPDVPLDLQAIVESIYEKSNYDMLVDYSEPVTGPVTDSEREWVTSIVSQHLVDAERANSDRKEAIQ